MIPRELFRKIRRMEIRTKGLVNNVFGGEYHSAFKGRGIEFSEVRPYQVGDDIRSIDWNVSARTGETFIKVFQEEREQTLMLLVDVSGSGEFGSHGMFKRELAAEICAVIAFSAIKNNDKVGMVLFSDHVELSVPPKKGRRHVLRLIRDLFAHEPEGKGTRLASALDHVARVLRRRSIVILLSDFFDNGYERSLRVLSRRHDVVSIELRDPRESELPSMGLLEVRDAETGQTLVLDTQSASVRRAYSERANARQKATNDLFRRLQVDRIQISTDESYTEPLVQFFRKRMRRA